MADEKRFVEDIADINSDFAQWYTDVVVKTGLADYGPVKGTMVIRPYGYGIWENIQRELDNRIKATGHKNAYFPTFIPYSFLTKEKEHVEGFAPEVALVTHYGEEELTEKLVVRPTSETMFGTMYAKWIQSYRDLPLLLNQWCNVFRCEKTTRPFLRTSEFLWQEGHTAHETEKEAREETLKMLSVYEEFSKNILAIPMILGRKSEKEKFAGAVETYTIEAMMKDGKSLQSGTSHYLGTNFAKAFNIKFLSKESKEEFVHTSSWGVSTRLIGAIIMAHGDERGIALPPNVAPIQAIVVPIAMHKEGVLEAAGELLTSLSKEGIRAEIDKTDKTPGFKFNEWEMKGVPLRVEIGPKDIENGQVVLVRRDTREKFVVKQADLAKEGKRLLSEIHTNMYEKALKHRDSKFAVCFNLSELSAALEAGNFAKAMWCGDRNCEDEIKFKTSGGTIRCLPFDQKPLHKECKCVNCGKPANKVVYIAKAY